MREIETGDEGRFISPLAADHNNYAGHVAFGAIGTVNEIDIDEDGDAEYLCTFGYMTVTLYSGEIELI